MVKEFVYELLDNAHNRRYEDKDNYAFLKVNIILSCYMLQNRDQVVKYIVLRELVGSKQADIADYILKTELRVRGVIKHIDDRNIVLTDDAMTAIAEVYDSPDFNYHLLHSIPYLEGGNFGLSNSITGLRFLELINNLDENDDTVLFNTTMTRLIAACFAKALPDITTKIPYPDEVGNVALISGPNKMWNFLLLVYPTIGPMNTDDINSSLRHITPIREWLRLEHQMPDLKVMVIGPTINDEKTDVSYWKKLGFAYHMWPVAFIRFMHMLKDFIEDELNNDAKEVQLRRQKVTENFISILHAPLISATLAMKILRSIVSTDRVIPYKLKTDETADWDYKIGLIRSEENYTIYEDSDNEYIDFDAIVIEYKNLNQVCRVIDFDKHKNKIPNLEFMSYDEFKSKLDKSDVQLILKAIAKSNIQ